MSSYKAGILRLSLCLLLVLLCFVLLRFAFWSYNGNIFPETGFLRLCVLSLSGLRFDISAILYANLPLLLWALCPFDTLRALVPKLLLQCCFVLFNGLLIAIGIADIIYFPYTMKRMTWDSTDMMGDAWNLLPSFLREFWYLIVIQAFVFVILILASKQLHTKTQEIGPARQVDNVFSQLLLFISCLALTIVGLRGGLQMKPLKPIDAMGMASLGEVALLTNSPFCVMHSMKSEALPDMQFMELEEAGMVRPYLKDYSRSELKNKGHNVIVIVIESLSSSYIGQAGKYAPFLDSLASKSIFFPEAYANAKKSIEGIPAIFSGIPAMMPAPFISSKYSLTPVAGLPAYLGEVGYQSAFFHGAENGSMHFDAYALSAGFERYFGRDEYGIGDFDGSWGVWDHKFLEFASARIAAFEEPFFMGLFTLNPHHPYRIPEQFPGQIDSDAEAFESSLRYVDKSLQSFFETISKEAFYKKTLFVITGDHTAPPFGQERVTRTGMYQIPILFYHPSIDLAELHASSAEMVQQVDILPTVLDFLGYSKNFHSLGSSIWEKQRPEISFQFLNGLYQAVTPSHIMLFDGAKSASCYNHQRDPYLTRQISGPECRKLRTELESFITLYRNGLLVNRW